jgi:hypothetical protein
VLFAWITVEVILLRTVVWLHSVYWGLALILIASAWILRRDIRPVRSHADVSVKADS